MKYIQEANYYKYEGDLEELIQIAKDDFDFITKNNNKDNREKWVLNRWIEASSLNIDSITIEKGGDPPDIIVNGQKIEIVEVIPTGRRRGDEYKQDMIHAQELSEFSVRKSSSGDIRVVKEHASDWVFEQVKKKSKKYTKKQIPDLHEWILLCYLNFSWIAEINLPKLLEGKFKNFNIPFKRIDLVFLIKEDNQFCSKKIMILPD